MPPKITPTDLYYSLWEALTQTSANAKNQAEVGRSQGPGVQGGSEICEEFLEG